MDTRVTLVEEPPSPETLAEAVRLLQQGEVVAAPTETVYGLAANALNEQAVAKIFSVKGRPTNNPIIVHVSSLAQAKELAKDWNETTDNLARRFWPGPLTLVVNRQEKIPNLVTAGANSVALRFPSHPVMQSLIELAGFPLAAPSANSSGHISPTRAEHVLHDLGGKIPLILDAGACSGGIESTVVDARQSPVRLLRPGGISAAMLESVAGPVEFSFQNTTSSKPLLSPGLLEKHYAPRTTAYWIEENLDAVREECQLAGWKYGILAWEEIPGALSLGTQPEEYARGLYDALHRLDAMGLDRILIIAPPARPEWLAIRDRLRRAALNWESRAVPERKSNPYDGIGE
ncbi:MAG: threonylcarbamoyl-AMP synthase [Gemmataceae bacterium]|nr:threonylcarbamoyl-AMP synthase [Gemmataceae bacterium]